MSSKFDQIRPWSVELAALESLKKSFTYMYLRTIQNIFMTCWLQVSDRCPLGYLFYLFASTGSDICLEASNSGTSLCGTNAHCINKQGSFTCECDPGFYGDGYTCTRSCELVLYFGKVRRLTQLSLSSAAKCNILSCCCYRYL